MKIEMHGRQYVSRINIDILGVKGFMGILKFWTYRNETWKSTGNLVLKMDTNPDTIPVLVLTIYSQDMSNVHLTTILSYYQDRKNAFCKNTVTAGLSLCSSSM